MSRKIQDSLNKKKFYKDFLVHKSKLKWFSKNYPLKLLYAEFCFWYTKNNSGHIPEIYEFRKNIGRESSGTKQVSVKFEKKQN